MNWRRIDRVSPMSLLIFSLLISSVLVACGATADAPSSGAADESEDVQQSESDAGDGVTPGDDAEGDGVSEPGDAGADDDLSADANDPPEQNRPPEQVEGNILDNPSFKAGAMSEGCPSEWTCFTYQPSDVGEFSADETTKYAGEFAVRWSGDDTPATIIKQHHPSGPGRKYDVAVRVKGENLQTAPFIHVLFEGANGILSDEKFRAEGAVDQWTQITATTSEAPAGTRQVRFNLSTDDTAGTVWWDEAAMVDVSDPDAGNHQDPADYEVIRAQGQVINIGNGEVFENKLIDLTTGQNIVISARGTNWTIRNIGFKGRKQAQGTLFGVADTGGGSSIIENIYMGDGSGRNGGRASCSGTSNCTHGPVGIWVAPDHSGHLTFRHINVQGWPNNGIYASAPGSNSNGKRGTIHIDQSYAANNYVSGFRIAGGSGNRITDSVSFNDAGDYNGRPIWVWKPGPIAVRGVHLDQGSYPYAMVAGANGTGTVVNLENSQVIGTLLEASGSTIHETNVGSSPDLTPPDGVPLSPEEAAGGRAGQ